MRALYLVIALIGTYSFAQTGTIKGTVIDNQSELPLLGATVQLLNVDELVASSTDENGQFVLENVDVGRQMIRVSYVGYESLTVPNIVVTSGKDAVVNVSLIESLSSLNTIVITPKAIKDRPKNEMAKVSARQFSVDEVTRFSGGRSDVGRLAANFAGVSAPDDSRNDIVIRGNSPTGLLWRLEGIPIPSPNHFGTIGTTGGPVSALNPNMLKNSDFITSAFPAEYGNAIGGVFDLGFRTGNADDYEFTGQVGAFTGLEAMAEGPLGKNQGSFLIAGRYSVIGLLGSAGSGTSAVPNYADLSFNLDFGNTDYGRFTLFGILGSSDIDFLADDIDEDDLFAAEDENSFVTSEFNVVGLNHRIAIGGKSYWDTTLSFSTSSNTFESDRFFQKDTPAERIIRFTNAENDETRIAVSTLFNSKINKRLTLRTGVVVENFTLEYLLQDRERQPDLNNDGDPDLFTFRNTDDSFTLYQPYAQTQYRLNENWIFNAGIHAQYSDLNEQFVFEPRAAVQYVLDQKNTFSFGYGIHHQNVPLPLLFLNEDVNGTLVQTNRNLDFVRSAHYVLGYDYAIADNWRAKIEVYRQDISDAAVESTPTSYSSLTEGADFGFSDDKVSLVNEGTGFNQGIELTVEKFFSDGYYGLLTSSIYESKYEGSDGIERNSPFNNGYVFNLLAGKEFPISSDGRNVLFTDTRITFAGGRYFTPVDLNASQQSGFEVLRDDIAFSQQYDDYFRWDVKIGLRFNSKKKKISHQFYVDLQNVTNRENVFVRRYNRLNNEVNQVDQIGFFPDVGYRIQF